MREKFKKDPNKKHPKKYDFRTFKIEDHIGEEFNYLTLIGTAPPRYYKHGRQRTQARFRCRCGNEVDAVLSYVLRDFTRSCGKKGCPYRNARMTHGTSNTRLNRLYRGIVQRTNNPNTSEWHLYGGRPPEEGPPIKMATIWYDPNKTTQQRIDEGNIEYQNFVKWAYESGYHDPLPGEPKKDWLTIERKDVNGPYSPDNCIWIPKWMQSYNTRRNSYIWDTEEWLTYGEFYKKYNLSYSWITSRLQSNWDFSAIVYAARHLEEGIHKPHPKKNEYRDKNGFLVLIRKIHPPEDGYHKQINKIKTRR